MKPKKYNYKELTKFVYDNLSWGPLYRHKDGKTVSNKDNNSKKYIDETLDIMKIPVSDLKNKRIFNIGSGRESRYLANQGAEVFHVDIAKKSSDALNKWAKENNKNVKSVHGDILDVDIGENKFDIILLFGIYQHIQTPALALVKFINALKKNGLMYMGFYRSGEWRWFLVDAIRYLLNDDFSLIKNISDIFSILFTFNNFNNYSTSRIFDDFYVPKKHTFHPKDIVHDIKLIGGKIFHFDNDFRDYQHETKGRTKINRHKHKHYFSIGGDRIYITKKTGSITDVKLVKKKLKTLKGKNQLFDISYKEAIINENIKLIKKIKFLVNSKYVSKTQLVCLIIGLHQFTRPVNFAKSLYYQESLKKGRHKALNEYLNNFINNFPKK